MPQRKRIVLTLSCFMVFALTQISSAAQQEGQRGQRGGGARVTRAPLFFKEVWKQTPAGGEHPVDLAQALSNQNLELKLYGPTGKEMLMTGSATDENNPIHLWTGMCTTPCGFTLRDRTNFADLTGL